MMLGLCFLELIAKCVLIIQALPDMQNVRMYMRRRLAAAQICIRPQLFYPMLTTCMRMICIQSKFFAKVS